MKAHTNTSLPTPEEFCRALGIKWRGYGNMSACCPTHEDNCASLSIGVGKDGRSAIFCCHAGCTQQEIRECAQLYDLYHRKGVRQKKYNCAPTAPTDANEEMVSKARKLVHRMQPMAGTLVERYLRNRGITITDRDIGFLRYVEPGWLVPAMVAVVRDGENDVIACQVTRLNAEAATKLQARYLGQRPVRQTFGTLGDGAVKLAQPIDVLGLAEGVETALSAMQLYGTPTWAALGLRLRAVTIPKTVKRIIIYADNDKAGIKQADEAGQRYVALGFKVTVKRPADPGDFNDVVKGLMP
jgi:hypothetical protein